MNCSLFKSYFDQVAFNNENLDLNVRVLCEYPLIIDSNEFLSTFTTSIQMNTQPAMVTKLPIQTKQPTTIRTTTKRETTKKKITVDVKTSAMSNKANENLLINNLKPVTLVPSVVDTLCSMNLNISKTRADQRTKQFNSEIDEIEIGENFELRNLQTRFKFVNKVRDKVVLVAVCIVLFCFSLIAINDIFRFTILFRSLLTIEDYDNNNLANVTSTYTSTSQGYIIEL
jgi:hypothetical protein